MRKADPVTPEMITPIEPSGEQSHASFGRSRGACGVTGCSARVSATGNSARQHMIASTL
ncbi:hypothetical protein GALL_540640 [mine drainage metagenome]|uniref:Uncharacterized protein n=1 Tax=mine drainage metagenome TaxID=410659 RepID=A0A1J5NYP3_9ZZZZ